jgi:hypothetical protein
MYDILENVSRQSDSFRPACNYFFITFALAAEKGSGQN